MQTNPLILIGINLGILIGNHELLILLQDQSPASRLSTTVIKTENNVPHYLISLDDFPQRSILEFGLINLNFSLWIDGRS